MTIKWRLWRLDFEINTLNGNHHGPKGTTKKNTIGFVKLGSGTNKLVGGRIWVYGRTGACFHVSLCYWRV